MSSIVGPVALDLYHHLSLTPIWNQWILRNAVSTFVIAIIGLWLFSFRKLENGSHRSAGVFEAVAGWIVVVGVYAAVFGDRSHLPIAYLILPLCVWVALRFSTTISALYVAAASLAIVVTTLHGRGPFAVSDPISRATLAESLVALVAFLTLVLALQRDEQDRLERRFRGLLAATPDSIIGVNTSGCIEIVNDRVEPVFGWTRAELLGQQIELLVPGAVKALHVSHRAGYAADPHPRQMGMGLPLFASRRDGTTFPVEISLNTIGDETGDLVILAAVRDVTERVELEQERQRQALEMQQERSQRLQGLGQLAGGVAHDFNNILGVILNYSTLVEGQISEPRAIADLVEIRNAAERGAGLTRQLLTFARNDQATPEALDMNLVVRNIGSMLERTIGDDIDIQIRLADGSLLTYIDPRQLEQVLLNLAINAP